MKFRDAVQANSMPVVVSLRANLHAASFTLMKLLPARYILDRATARGMIGRNTTVAETTSGTFGLGLAMVCALRRQPLVLVSDPVVDVRLKRRLEELGAKVHIVSDRGPVGGYQQARLDRLAELETAFQDVFVPRQYDNPLNAEAYEPVSRMLDESVGKIDWLVGAVGSGGSMCGTTAALRLKNPNLRAIAVDTHGSVLFGHPDRPRILRGLGNSLLPGNVSYSTFDEVHWVGAGEAVKGMRLLNANHALFMGPTSGAVYTVAKWLADSRPGDLVACLFADEGHRYQDTFCDPDWLTEQGVQVPETLDGGPYTVRHPREAMEGWARMEWARRPRREVLGHTGSDMTDDIGTVQR